MIDLIIWVGLVGSIQRSKIGPQLKPHNKKPQTLKRKTPLFFSIATPFCSRRKKPASTLSLSLKLALYTYTFSLSLSIIPTMPSLALSDAILSETPKDKKIKKMKNSETLETDQKIKSKLKESKKRKALEDDEEERSDTSSSELIEPVVDSKESKKKKAKFEEEDPNAVSKFRISAKLKAKLKEKGIEALFPIQAMTFNTVLDGSDLIGRARTGQVYFLCTYRFI